MEHPNYEMAAAVVGALTMANKLDAMTFHAEHRVPDRVIVPLLSEHGWGTGPPFRNGVSIIGFRAKPAA